MLALARAEPAGLATSASLDLATLIRTRVEFWLPEAIARDIDLGFELDSASIAGTPLLIEELLGNLVDNALAYTPAEAGSRSVAAVMEARRSCRWRIAARVFRPISESMSRTLRSSL